MVAKIRTNVGRGKVATGPGPVGVAKSGYFGDGLDGNDPGRPDEQALALVTEAMCQAWADEEAQAVRSLLEPCPLVVHTAPASTPVLPALANVGCPHCGGEAQVPADGAGPETTVCLDCGEEFAYEGPAGKAPVKSPAHTLAADLKGKLEATHQADYDARRHGPPHLMVKALAGTGKTTTLVQGARAVVGLDPTIMVTPNGDEVLIEPSPQQEAIWAAMAEGRENVKTVGFVAFGTDIAAELARRVPPGCEAMTLHKLGYRAVNSAYGFCSVDRYRVGRLVAELTGLDKSELMEKEPGLLQAVEKLVALVKLNLVPLDVEDDTELGAVCAILDDLARHYDVDLEDYLKDRVYDLVPQVVARCRQLSDRTVDFNDMVWLPTANGLAVRKYDLLMVDEAQDLNRAQQALARAAGRRLVFCGDPNQAIFGFAGADSESMPRLSKELAATPRGCLELPLTVTRRCGKAIVAEAQCYVPEFEAHADNAEGRVLHAGMRGAQVDGRCYEDVVAPGDFVLCRVTAVLLAECFRHLAQGRRALVLGRDIGKGLKALVRSFKVDTIPELVTALDAWLAQETAKERARTNPNEQRLIALQDKHACLMVFVRNSSSMKEVVARIDSLFTDNAGAPAIIHATIHKAKGLEASRVFFLRPKAGPCPHPMSRTPWQKGQELNLCYVAVTRAISELYHVSDHGQR
jgi:DNA helicase II / ATP-dependent DNA helicase PcrA